MRELSLNETRVIGALIEKEVTTPDHYPLSLNALTNACNQKSNREPVLSLSEGEVQEVVDALIEASLITEQRVGSRVAKYKHRFCNTQFSEYHLSPPEAAIICLLFLRGPQTPGELRSRSGRLHAFKSVPEVESALGKLLEKEGGPMVCKLEREPGRRESRFMHLLSGEVKADASHSSVTQTNSSSPQDEATHERIEALEQQVASMQEEINLLKKQWEELNS